MKSVLGTTWSSVQVWGGCRFSRVWNGSEPFKSFSAGSIHDQFILKDHFEIWRIDWKRVSSVAERLVRRNEGETKELFWNCLAQSRALSKYILNEQMRSKVLLWSAAGFQRRGRAVQIRRSKVKSISWLLKKQSIPWNDYKTLCSHAFSESHLLSSDS